VDASQTFQADKQQTTNSQESLSLKGQHVLLVEDCVEQGRLFLKILQLAGADVTLECNGEAAVDTFNKSSVHFDAIVMDFLMPEMDGLESTSRLRQLGYSGAIIAVTAYDTEKLKRAWFLAGCNEYLIKPLKKEQLINSVLCHSRR